MMTSRIIIVDDKHEIVVSKKIKHTDRRDMRWQLCNKIKHDRRLRKEIDRHRLMIIVADAGRQFKLEDELKKKS